MWSNGWILEERESLSMFEGSEGLTTDGDGKVEKDREIYLIAPFGESFDLTI